MLRVRNLLLLFHIAGAIFWMGGMAFVAWPCVPPSTPIGCRRNGCR